jgi:NADP-dependent 3-hydroxy acid dehydrogenase YdfG
MGEIPVLRYSNLLERRTMANIAVVTGAGSGVGRAVAHKLAAAGWRVALIGRREAALRETAATAQEPQRLTVVPADVGDVEQVRRAFETIRAWAGADGVELLVNAAGTNIPRRSLTELSVADYQLLIDTNLNGAFYCVHEVLSGMRARNRGTIVNIVSDAGLTANAKAGAAYAASKFGMTGLTQSINAEERERGIRACAICPGDIDTPILDRRPNPPSAEARLRMLRAEDVAECVMLAVNLPQRAVVEQVVIRPRG